MRLLSPAALSPPRHRKGRPAWQAAAGFVAALSAAWVDGLLQFTAQQLFYGALTRKNKGLEGG